MNDAPLRPPSGTVTLVVPVYDEERVMPALVRRLRALRETLAPDTLRVLLVDDGSRDGTAALVDEAATHPGFTGIHLSRNFGHQAAVTAGIDHADGDFVAVIDGDLQDPPELIPAMLAALRAGGADVVYGVRRNRKEHALKRVSYFAFYRLLAFLSPLEIPLDSGDFCMMTRRVADAMRSMPERQRFLRGLRSYAGFKQVPFEYERDARAAGAPKYTLWKLVRLALDGIFSFSAVPLRIATYMGFLVSLGSLGYGVALVVWRILTVHPIPGFATIAVALFFLGGVQLVCLGILGEYIARIYGEIKQRPPYIVASITPPPDPQGEVEG
jgi:dolichol-phosphate mannosyltransferase